MKFTINREKLLEPLQLVCGVVERRQTAPILSNLLLSLADGILTLTSTDQEVEISVRIPGIEDGEDGEVTVPARKLMDICRSLPDGADMTATLEGKRVAVGSGRFSSFLATLPISDFPEVEISEPRVSFELEEADLARLLARTSFAMAQQDVRYFFNGILIEIRDHRLRFVATNGQRLATTFVSLDEPGNYQFIIPRKAVAELSRLLGSGDPSAFRLSFTANHIEASRKGARLISKLIDATYPDYTRAIPAEGDKVMLSDRKLLREALSRTAILSNELYRNVRLLLQPGKLDLHANNPQQEEAEESVSVEYEGETLEIGFNVSYLIEALSAIEGEVVRITFTDPGSACLIEDVSEEESLFVISPMVL